MGDSDTNRDNPNPLPDDFAKNRRQQRELALWGRYILRTIVLHMRIYGAGLEDAGPIFVMWNDYLQKLENASDPYRDSDWPFPAYYFDLKQEQADLYDRVYLQRVWNNRKRALGRAMAAYIAHIGDPQGDLGSLEVACQAFRRVLLQEAEKPDGFLEGLDEALRELVLVSLCWERSPSPVRGRSRFPRVPLRSTEPCESFLLPLLPFG